jgi:hypothetical protein
MERLRKKSSVQAQISKRSVVNCSLICNIVKGIFHFKLHLKKILIENGNYYRHCHCTGDSILNKKVINLVQIGL